MARKHAGDEAELALARKHDSSDVLAGDQPSLFLQETQDYLAGAQARIDALPPVQHAGTEITAHARLSDPETSREAARAATVGLTQKQQAVYECLLLLGPLTDPGIKTAYLRYRDLRAWPAQSDSGLRTRRKELCDREPPLVIDDGKLFSGKRNHTIWRAVST